MMSDLDVNIQPSSLDKKNDKVSEAFDRKETVAAVYQGFWCNFRYS